MAVAFEIAVYDGRRCKIFRLLEAAANAAVGDFTTTFAANGMTDFQGAGVPLEGDFFMRASAANENVQAILSAISATGFTFRKISVGANATAIEWQVCIRIPRGIAA